MAQPKLRDLATVILRDLVRPTHSKIVLLAVLFAGSLKAVSEGNLAIGGPVAVVILVLLIMAVTQGARLGLFPPMTTRRLYRMDDDRVDCPVCDGHGFLLGDDDSEIECEQCDGSGKMLGEKAETQAG